MTVPLQTTQNHIDQEMKNNLHQLSHLIPFRYWEIKKMLINQNSRKAKNCKKLKNQMI